MNQRCSTLISYLFFFFLSGISHKTIAAEGDTYNFSWLDPDKEVYVLQNRRYRKDSRLYVNVGGGIATSGAFVSSGNLQGRIGLFAMEEWGLEFFILA